MSCFRFAAKPHTKKVAHTTRGEGPGCIREGGHLRGLGACVSVGHAFGKIMGDTCTGRPIVTPGYGSARSVARAQRCGGMAGFLSYLLLQLRIGAKTAERTTWSQTPNTASLHIIV